ncbi:MAG: glycosyltransferase family 4 protein [Fischerella sp.]|nr:glycosyltransferase family 4 protein [Fischerella sp.]
MKIGYLHIGPVQHGIRRYSELIASEARQRGFTIIEASVVLTEDRHKNRAMLMAAAKQLAAADVIHLQHNKLLWGKRSQRYYLQLLMRNCSCPLIVTMHDVYVLQVPFSWRNIFNYAKAKYGPTAWNLRWMCAQVQQVLVCTKQEAQRLEYLVGTNTVNNKVKVISHFVEERTVTVSYEVARKALNLEKYKIITLLGWIFPRKGHRLVVEALPQLPSNVKVIFAGRPSDGCESFSKDLVDLSKKLGVEDRLQITGYLSEQELEQYLVATDVAICPFQTSSASGSLSTWISVAHPAILAFDLPLIGEYNKLEPGAIQTFSPYTPTALADRIKQLLLSCQQRDNTAMKNLRQRLCMSAIFDEHLRCYYQAVPAPIERKYEVLQPFTNK